MGSGRTPRLFIVLAVLAGALTLGPASRAAPVNLTCGQPVTTSVVLGNNLEDCPAAGLVVAANGITIDLNGHRISAATASASPGIDNLVGSTDVTIKNGTIDNFDTGVAAWGVRNVVQDLIVTRAINHGIFLTLADDTVVRRNVILRSGTAIQADNSTGVTISQNTGVRNTGDGIALDTTDASSIASNRLFGNNFGISLLDASNNNSISGNHASANRIDGIFLQASTGNSLSRNTTSGNDVIGIRLNTGATGNTLIKNTTTANTQSGIVVQGGPNTLRENNASSNNDYGIAVNGGIGIVLVENRAHENGAEGILGVVPAEFVKNSANANGYLNGTTNVAPGLGLNLHAASTGRRNTAQNNDTDAQCFPTTICKAGSAREPSGLVSCGQTLTRSIRVRNNLLNCGAGGGLIVGAPKITVDLGGHRIDGNFAGTGILNAGFRKVVIRSGVVTNFNHQIRVQSGVGGNARGTTVTRLLVTDVNLLSSAAIRVSDANRVAVTRNTVVSDALAVRVEATSEKVTVSRNSLFSHAGAGTETSKNVTITKNNAITTVVSFFAGGQASSVGITKNVARGSAQAGISVVDAVGVRVDRNSVAGVGGHGIELALTPATVSVTRNAIRGTGGDGINAADGTGISIRENSITAADANGITLGGGATAQVVENGVHENGVHGIASAGAGMTISRNRAFRNGFVAPAGLVDGVGRGITADPGTGGSRNKVAGNDDDANQCVPPTLC